MKQPVPQQTAGQPKGFDAMKARMGEKSIMEQMPQVFEQMPPEMQQDFVKAVSLGVIAFYNEKFLPKAREMIGTGERPAAGIGRVVGMIGARIYHSARKANQEIPGEVLLLAGAELTREVADYAEEKMGIEISEEVMTDAFLAASQNFQAAMAGNGPKVQASAEDYEKMVALAGGAEAIQALSERMKMSVVPFNVGGGKPPAQGQEPAMPPQRMGLDGGMTR